MTAPHDGHDIAGDACYAPYELFCGARLTQDQKRFGCDVYLLGSMFFFLFVGMHINPILSGFLPPNQQVRKAMYDFDQFLPYIEEACGEAIHQFSTHIPDCPQELTEMVAQLCHPDPTKRGHPSKRGFNQYSLEIYISRLDNLAKRTELTMARR